MNDIHLDASLIELFRSALEQNLAYIRDGVGEGVTISSVIKANAYGHGIETFLPMAEASGIGHFSVFSADEAAKARRSQSNPDTRNIRAEVRKIPFHSGTCCRQLNDRAEICTQSKLEAGFEVVYHSRNLFCRIGL
ncbi:MAG: alanine racemase [Balneolaceae bacterium]